MAERFEGVKLYEITAMVSYSVVIAATSQEEAMAEVETWENAWHDTADLVGVSDVDMFDVRDIRDIDDVDDLDDDAHVVTNAAHDLISKALGQEEAR